MRTIDADALKDRLQNLSYDDWNQGVSTSWADAYKECADIVDEMPTIEPERKRGKWIDFSMSIKGVPTEACGECGEWSLGMGKNFCPNCGAYMGKDT